MRHGDVLEQQKKLNDAEECFKTAEEMARQEGDVELAAAIALRRVKHGPYNS